MMSYIRVSHAALLATGLFWFAPMTITPAAADAIRDCTTAFGDPGYVEEGRYILAAPDGGVLLTEQIVECRLYTLRIEPNPGLYPPPYQYFYDPTSYMVKVGTILAEVPLANPDPPIVAPTDRKKRILLDVLQGKTRATETFKEGENPPEFRIRTVPSCCGVRGALEDVPVFALATASPDWSIGMLSIPEDISILSFVFNVEDNGDGDSLGLFFGNDLLWHSLLTDFTENAWYAAEFDVSPFAGQTRPFTYVLFSEGPASARVTVSAELFAYTADELADSAQQMAEVPEPATLALLGIGLVGFGFTFRGAGRTRSNPFSLAGH